MGDGKKAKQRKKTKKDSQMVIRIATDDRDAFISLCEELDTSASREIRRFVRHFIVTNGTSAAPAPRKIAGEDGADGDTSSND